MNPITKRKIAKAYKDDQRDEVDKKVDPNAYEVEVDEDEDK